MTANLGLAPQMPHQKVRMPMIKVALYARYSSDNQRDASITDQLRVCRAHAEKQGWQIVEEYTDHAISGASLLRPGIQALLSDAQKRRFHIVLAEAMDRLSRDQEDIAGLFKRMAFGSVKIFTLSEGEVSHLHVGLKGTMNALFLKDLADKTRRGLRGRIEDGKSGGGLCFGYDVVRKFDANGEPVRGDRTINQAESAVVRRIFREYVAGKSSRTIAFDLNKERIRGPQGSEWGPSTIHGNPKRGVGILNNELYIGRLIWNRLRYVKDPDSGRRVSRLNPESDWLIHDVPEMRIVDQEIWGQAKARQQSLSKDPQEPSDNFLNDRRRPKHLLSGLVRCGSCGGGVSMISKDLLGCSSARNKGTCDNRMNIRRDALETSVLVGLRTHLMEPELFKAFCDEFTREVNRLRIERDATAASWRDELERVKRNLDKAIQAILDGVPGAVLKDKIGNLEDRKAVLVELVANSTEPAPLLHPNMAEIYRRRISELHERLYDDEGKAEAVEVLRTLIDEVALIPEGNELTIALRGDLAAILAFASNKKKPSPLSEAGLMGDLLSPVSLVRGQDLNL
ncbi:MAG: recombinase family protein [Candidatus Sphingomonas colombiensis]|nr:recombinase family protein [Sphingomonas sp.]WEK43299.1 MAG: recombinase family protein [Sphingomonas sp.]